MSGPAGAFWDVVVAGSGPAALGATCALAGEGLRVLRVGPPARWAATYCCWWDEVVAAAHELGLGDTYALATRYDSPLVRTASAGEVLLPRAYARLDNDVLATTLRARAREFGAVERAGRLRELRREGTTTYAVLEDGTHLPTGLVIDATGAAAATGPQQRAWGEVVEGTPDLLPAGGALFMDWVSADLVGGADGAAAPAAPPVFLYGLDLGDGTALLELTSLAARPPVELAVLKPALHALLHAHGIRPLGRSERVAIPLGRRGAPPGPWRGTRFGAAAGLVHPATGYSVMGSLLLARPLARAAVRALDSTEPARMLEAAAWPPGRRLGLALLERGLDTLLPLGQHELDAFFGAFFGLPETQWRAYLDLRSGPVQIAAAMSATLGRLPTRLRLAAVRGTLGSAAPLLRPRDPRLRTPTARGLRETLRGDNR